MPGPFYFAWSGGAIEPQVAITTTGTTHGAAFEQRTLVGDTLAGASQLTNIVSTDGLEVGALYHLTGNGTDAYFVYDATVLSGLPDSVNLTSPAGSTVTSSIFQATRSVTIGTVLATLNAGSNAVTLAAGALAAGLYGIAGTGIGEVTVPLGTTEGTTVTSGGDILIVGSAAINYAGGSSGTMQLLAAEPHTETGTDDFGTPTSITTYAVVIIPVRATASGQFGVVLTGFPEGDPAIVTEIPSGTLMSLTPGLRYNVSGNGIPLGATFLAPASGTQIELDVPATASDISAQLTITGPRTPGAPFDPAVHNRFDEDVLSVEITQEEGNFATLTIDIKNPGIGLLATGRSLWCWLSWDQAWVPGGPEVLPVVTGDDNPVGTPSDAPVLTSTADLVPLFNGRLIGVPRLQAGEVVQLQFLARPEDFSAQKATLAASLQVLPWFDPIWLSSTVTEDTVLETYSALWHIDPVSLDVTISDVIEGEDGTVAIGEELALYANFSLSYGAPPLVATTVTGTVAWNQQASGILDITDRLIAAFNDAGSYYNSTFATSAYGGGGGGLIQVMCGDGLKSDWPTAGSAIGGGWSFTARVDGDGVPMNYIVDASDPAKGGWIQPFKYSITFEQSAFTRSPLAGTSPFAIFSGTASGTTTTDFPISVYKIRTTLEYRANRRRTETVHAVVVAGVQRQLSDSSEQDSEAISMTSEVVGEAVDLDGTVPIGDVAYRSYFQTARGAASLEYLLLAARAKMRARARSVDVNFAVPWREALGLSLRHSVLLTDRRLPGGVATGKVKSYRLSASDSGMLGEFTLGCTIGTGDGWDMAYQTLDDFNVVDDGLDLSNVTAEAAVNECRVINGLTTQLTAIAPYQGATIGGLGTPATKLVQLETKVTLDLKPVAGSEFHTDFFPAVTLLAIPRTIDLTDDEDYVPVEIPPLPGTPAYVETGYTEDYQAMQDAYLDILGGGG